MRRVLAALVAMSVIAATTPTAAESIAGDVNNDGVVNSVDAFHLLQFSAGIILPVREKADVNDDGIENALDAVLILQFHAGLIPTLSNAEFVPSG